MKKVLEGVAVVILGFLTALLMSFDNAGPGPTDASATAVVESAAGYDRAVVCTGCGRTVYVAGKPPYDVRCECGEALAVVDVDGHTLAVDTSGVGVEIVPPEPKPALAEPTEVNWIESFDEARALARKTGKPLLALSTKSFGCPPCELLKTGPFSDPETVAWLNENFVCCRLIDRPLPIADVRGYPAVWLRLPGGRGWLWAGKSPIPTSTAAFREAIEERMR